MSAELHLHLTPAGKVKRSKFLRRNFGCVSPTTSLSMPKITLRVSTSSLVRLLSTTSHQRTLPTHVSGTLILETDVRLRNECFRCCKVTRWRKFGSRSVGWARERTGAEKLLCDEKWICKCGSSCTTLTMTMSSPGLKMLRHGCCWVLLVKHQSSQSLVRPVTGKGALLKFVDGPQRCGNVLHEAPQPQDTP